MRIARFSLRGALLAVGCIAFLLGITVNYASRSRAQKFNVAILEGMGANLSNPRVSVLYDDDLKWNESEHRFQLRLRSFDTGAPPQLDPKRTRFSGWVTETFGRDFAHSAVAIEIDCYDFEDSTFDMELCHEIIDQIRKLPTVRQVWIREWKNVDGETFNEMTNTELAKRFPDLIVANPQ